MSVDLWNYDPDKCDGMPCIGDCDMCRVAIIVRCNDCIHQKWCDQCIEKNGVLYHLDYCSLGEKEHENEHPDRCDGNTDYEDEMLKERDAQKLSWD